VRDETQRARAAHLVLGLVDSEEIHVRSAAASALGFLGHSASVDELARLLEDEAEDLSWTPLQVGGGIARPPMSMRKPACAALLSLGRLKAKEEAVKIAEMTSSEDWEVRCCAAQALGQLEDKGLEHDEQLATLLDDVAYRVREAACAALAALGAESHVGAVVELFTDTSPRVRQAAVTALASMGESGAELLSEVFPLLQDDASIVRAAAAKTLGAFSQSQGFASVLATTMLGDPEPAVRREVVNTLSTMGEYGAAFEEEIAELLKDPSPSVRSAAAVAVLSFRGTRNNIEDRSRQTE